MTTYEDLKKHCESVPVNHMGMRIACVQADTILELIARVEAAEHASAPTWQPIETAPTWQPIETAPKDGRWIVVAMEGGYPDTMRWRNSGWNNGCGGRNVFPEYWMPIPELPK